MTDRGRNVMVGVFMLGCLVLMGLMVVWFGGRPYLFSPRYYVKMVFPKSAGIGANTSIFMNGQRIGNIESVDFVNKADPSAGVLMIARIEPDINLPKFAEPTILTPIFAGKSTIGIDVTEELRAAAPEDQRGFLAKIYSLDGAPELKGVVSQGLLDKAPQLIAKIEAASDQFTSLGQTLEKVATNLDELTLPRSLVAVDSQPGSGPATGKEMLANLSTVVQRLDNTLKYINLVIGKDAVRVDLEQSIANIRKASDDLVEAIKEFKAFGEKANVVGDKAIVLADNVNAGVTQTRGDIGQLVTRAVGVLDGSNKLVNELTVAATELNSTTGTVGRLLRDPRLYEGLVIAADRLKVLIAELELRAKEWKSSIPIQLK